MDSVKVGSKLLVVLCTIILVMATQTSTVLAYCESTHEKITAKAVDLIQHEVYAEIPLNRAALLVGSVEEDSDFRNFNHFYTPGIRTGLEWHWWYVAWGLDEGFLAGMEDLAIGEMSRRMRQPASGYFHNAKEWGREFGSNNINWMAAIRAYGYTRESRGLAYRILGSVVHLVQDMAEPDHVMLAPHAGSSFNSNDFNQKIGHRFGLFVANCPPDMVGFERLISDSPFTYQAPIGFLLRRDTFDAHFDEMAQISIAALSASGGLQVPLGVTGATGLGIPIRPNIDTRYSNATQPYLNLAQTLIPKAIQYSASLLMHFHDIVNQPPYVDMVSISQVGATVTDGYLSYWDDDRGFRDFHVWDTVGRHRTTSGKGITAGIEATIRVDFGPGVSAEEIIAPGTVQVLFGGQQISGQLSGNNTWVGTFTPSVAQPTEFRIEIRARDVHFHYPRQGLPDMYYELDSDPATPARATPKPPYDWVGYEVGADTNHTVWVFPSE